MCRTAADLTRVRMLLNQIDVNDNVSDDNVFDDNVSDNNVSDETVNETTNDDETVNQNDKILKKWLIIQQPMRWLILERFYCLKTDDVISLEKVKRLNYEMERDKTREGVLASVRCKSALPDESLKRKLWPYFLRIDSVLVEEMAASMEGFNQRHPDHNDMMHEFTAKFFQDVSLVFSAAPRNVAIVFWDRLFPVMRSCKDSLHFMNEFLQCLTENDRFLRRLAYSGNDQMMRANACKELCLLDT
eukprot:GHVL01035410.1.p2 GENE.GHVL01035410.1~~GHVL01035410.1.p2  ORF type:complete len:245 (+),score=61.81 GHVL01035410.1:2441-3175(+)